MGRRGSPALTHAPGAQGHQEHTLEAGSFPSVTLETGAPAEQRWGSKEPSEVEPQLLFWVEGALVCVVFVSRWLCGLLPFQTCF